MKRFDKKKHQRNIARTMSNILPQMACILRHTMDGMDKQEALSAVLNGHILPTDEDRAKEPEELLAMANEVKALEA